MCLPVQLGKRVSAEVSSPLAASLSHWSTDPWQCIDIVATSVLIACMVRLMQLCPALSSLCVAKQSKFTRTASKKSRHATGDKRRYGSPTVVVR